MASWQPKVSREARELKQPNEAGMKMLTNWVVDAKGSTTENITLVIEKWKKSGAHINRAMLEKSVTREVMRRETNLIVDSEGSQTENIARSIEKWSQRGVSIDRNKLEERVAKKIMESIDSVGEELKRSDSTARGEKSNQPHWKIIIDPPKKKQ